MGMAETKKVSGRVTYLLGASDNLRTLAFHFGLNNIEQGIAANERIGKKISVKRIWAKVSFSSGDDQLVASTPALGADLIQTRVTRTVAYLRSLFYLCRNTSSIPKDLVKEDQSNIAGGGNALQYDGMPDQGLFHQLDYTKGKWKVYKDKVTRLPTASGQAVGAIDFATVTTGNNVGYKYPVALVMSGNTGKQLQYPILTFKKKYRKGLVVDYTVNQVEDGGTYFIGSGIIPELQLAFWQHSLTPAHFRYTQGNVFGGETAACDDSLSVIIDYLIEFKDI